jgi:hypothetical protein
MGKPAGNRILPEGVPGSQSGRDREMVEEEMVVSPIAPVRLELVVEADDEDLMPGRLA